MITLAPETLCDGYKVDHRRQYPDNTQLVLSNFTPRGTRRNNVNEVVFFGLQYFIKEYLINQWNENFFKKEKSVVLERFQRRINNYLGPNQIGVSHIAALHDLGYLPISIRALPEGTVYGLRVPSLTIENTLPEFFWLTNYLETILSTTLWGPCTSATTALQYKKLFNKYAKQTVGDTSFVQWQGHDFSFRGMFGLEAAVMSGAGHLTSFTGTDTIPAIEWLETYYNADSSAELVGGSVAATEHSVACSTILNFVEKVRIQNGNRTEDELMDLADVEYVRHLITDIYPEGIVSIVADSFDYWNTITKTAKVLKDTILNRKGKVVFRPDTGDPVKVVCGYFPEDVITLPNGKIYERNFVPHSEEGNIGKLLSESEVKGSIECLWDLFGGTVTAQGYKVLDSHVGLIYGDSINYERAYNICEGLAKKGFASTNVVYGIGSYTYQCVTRDTDQYAVKATFAVVDGKEVIIYKKPKTGDGMKNSAAGRVVVKKTANNKFVLVDRATEKDIKNSELKEVFRNGKLLIEYSLSDIRNRINSYIS